MSKRGAVKCLALYLSDLVDEVLEGEHLYLGPGLQLGGIDQAQVDKGLVPQGLQEGQYKGLL